MVRVLWTWLTAMLAVDCTAQERTTLCALSERLESLPGRTVEVEAYVERHEHGTHLFDAGCNRRILIQFPSEAKANASVRLLEDRVFKAFYAVFFKLPMSEDEEPLKMKAVLQGHFELAGPPGGGKPDSGFGHLSQARRRLIVTRVLSFTIHP